MSESNPNAAGDGWPVIVLDGWLAVAGGRSAPDGGAAWSPRAHAPKVHNDTSSVPFENHRRPGEVRRLISAPRRHASAVEHHEADAANDAEAAEQESTRRH